MAYLGAKAEINIDLYEIWFGKHWQKCPYSSNSIDYKLIADTMNLFPNLMLG